MERKLASIRKITDIKPIEGADMIEMAIVDGWEVVIKKGEYNVGDFCVYCEIDSFLPIKPEFEFLRKSSFRKNYDKSEGFRLKTIKLRGQISQGLVLPISVVPETVKIEYGTDVTEVLGIVKYEAPIPSDLAGKMKGGFPSFLTKTDEERVQNLSSKYNSIVISGDEFYATEKLDGSSATFYLNNGEFGVCSRNLELIETPDNTFWKVARELKIEEKLRKFGKNICLQGELIGEGIESNKYKVRGQTVYFFNVFDIDKHKKYDYNSFINTIDVLGLNTVPIIENFELPDTVNDLLKYADGQSKLNPNTIREGIVIRNKENTISFKAISNNFLLCEK